MKTVRSRGTCYKYHNYQDYAEYAEWSCSYENTESRLAEINVDDATTYNTLLNMMDPSEDYAWIGLRSGTKWDCDPNYMSYCRNTLQIFHIFHISFGRIVLSTRRFFCPTVIFFSVVVFLSTTKKRQDCVERYSVSISQLCWCAVV